LVSFPILGMVYIIYALRYWRKSNGIYHENLMSEPMKVNRINGWFFHGWPVAMMKYPWNAFIGHERVSFHGFIT